MAVPIAGTNAGSLTVYNAGGSSPFKESKVIQGFCVDSSGTYAYLLISGWFSSATTLNGAITTGATSIVLTSATNYAASGYVNITDNSGNPLLVAYTGISTNTLTGVTGVTENVNTGNAVKQAATICKVQLSNLSLVGSNAFFWPLSITPQSGTGIFYDNANSLVCVLDSSNKLWSLPSGGGSSPFTLTQVGSAALACPNSNWGGLQYDPNIGIVWNVASNANKNYLGGFWYKDPTGINSDFTAAYHPMAFGGEGSSTPAGMDAIAFTPGILGYGNPRMAICQGSNNSFASVLRWRQDQMRLEVLADGAGQTNSTSNGATPGTAIANPTALCYDSGGNLYVTSGVSLYQIDNATESVFTGPITLAGATIIGCPRFMATGGFSGVGNGQLIYMAGGSSGQYQTLEIAY
jgi:hypothetical protein